MTTPRPSGTAGSRGNVPVESPYPSNDGAEDRGGDLAGCMFEACVLIFGFFIIIGLTILVNLLLESNS